MIGFHGFNCMNIKSGVLGSKMLPRDGKTGIIELNRG